MAAMEWLPGLLLLNYPADATMLTRTRGNCLQILRDCLRVVTIWRWPVLRRRPWLLALVTNTLPSRGSG